MVTWICLTFNQGFTGDVWGHQKVSIHEQVFFFLPRYLEILGIQTDLNLTTTTEYLNPAKCLKKI